MHPTRSLRGVLPRSSYYGRDYRAEAALIRARQPYLVKNIITGICLTGITIGIYAMTFHLVKQDDFSDVPIPDMPVSSASAPHASANRQADSAELKTSR